MHFDYLINQFDFWNDYGLLVFPGDIIKENEQ